MREPSDPSTGWVNSKRHHPVSSLIIVARTGHIRTLKEDFRRRRGAPNFLFCATNSYLQIPALDRLYVCAAPAKTTHDPPHAGAKLTMGLGTTPHLLAGDESRLGRFGQSWHGKGFYDARLLVGWSQAARASSEKSNCAAATTTG